MMRIPGLGLGPWLVVLTTGCGALPWGEEASQLVDDAAARAEEATAPTPTPAGPPDRPPSCAANPVDMVRSAYAPYLAELEPGPLVRAACWTPDMAQAIEAAAQQAADAGTSLLGFDPLVNGQEFSVDALMIERRSDNEVVAHFTNFGRPQSVHWTLRGEPGTQRVSDLHTDSWRLSERITR
ncbi:MAG: hypothetical protein CL927_09265 [Deltaproteobacteria bacterium]|nr:hypothetical protein [Deltaproteobacteria bacterium]